MFTETLWLLFRYKLNVISTPCEKLIKDGHLNICIKSFILTTLHLFKSATRQNIVSPLQYIEPRRSTQPLDVITDTLLLLISIENIYSYVIKIGKSLFIDEVYCSLLTKDRICTDDQERGINFTASLLKQEFPNKSIHTCCY